MNLLASGFSWQDTQTLLLSTATLSTIVKPIHGHFHQHFIKLMQSFTVIAFTCIGLLVPDVF